MNRPCDFEFPKLSLTAVTKIGLREVRVSMYSTNKAWTKQGWRGVEFSLTITFTRKETREQDQPTDTRVCCVIIHEALELRIGALWICVFHFSKSLVGLFLETLLCKGTSKSAWKWI